MGCVLHISFYFLKDLRVKKLMNYEVAFYAGVLN